MKIVRPLIAAAVLSTALTAAAADTGWYVGADIGRSKDKDTKDGIDSAFIGAGATAYNSSYDDSENSYNVFLGYNFNKNFALEGGYLDLGNRDFSATYTGGAASGHADVDGWKVSAVGTLPINDVFSVNGKIHLLYSNVDVALAATGPGGAAAGSASDRSWDWGFGLGMEYKLNSQWALRGNYDLYKNVGDNNNTGESDVDVWTVGVKYSF